jgi:RHS repeat-associated protein
VGGVANAGPGTSTQSVYCRGGLRAQYSNGQGLWFAHLNALGSTQQFTDSSGANPNDSLFYPFGQLGPQGSGAYFESLWSGFEDGNFWSTATGEWQTDTRRYTPGAGRWYTPDPIGKAAARLDDPQTWNMYAYVRNNPTTLTDPSGETDLTHMIFGFRHMTGQVGEEIIATSYLEKQAATPLEINLDRVVDYMDKHALGTDSFRGICATVCHLALEAGGLTDTEGRPIAAKDNGPWLEEHGAAPVASSEKAALPKNYSPEKGDIAIFSGGETHRYGHMQIYNGKLWESDTKQSTFSPNRNYEGGVVIYRFPR